MPWGRLCWLLLAMAALRPVNAQGFMIRPLVVDLKVHPGDNLLLPFELRNTGREASFTVDFFLLDLSQAATGGWVPVDPQAPEHALFTGRSCRDWLSIDQTVMELPALESRTANVEITVPRRARGTYAASLAVRRRPMGQGGVQVSVQFLVPILLTIQGLPARQNIEAADAILQRVEAGPKSAATTLAGMAVRNSGEVFAPVGGTVRVLRPAGDFWRPVAESDLRPLNLLPGVEVRMTADLRRRLPSGRYKVQTLLRVSGAPRGMLEQVIEFAGDPTVTTIPEDVPLRIDPPDLLVDAVPGSHRTNIVTIQNPTEATIRVATSIQVHAKLSGVAMGPVNGTDFSCHEWTRVEPSSFTLPPGGQRNLKLTISPPRDATAKANYYAVLHAVSRYPDGQSAGEGTALIAVRNPALDLPPEAAPLQMTVAHLADSRYTVSARFGNIGQSMWVPAARVTLLDRLGFGVLTATMEGDSERILPLGTPQFAGELDLSRLDPGVYFVEARMDYAGATTAQQLPVEVALDGEQRRLTVLRDAASAAPAGEGGE